MLTSTVMIDDVTAVAHVTHPLQRLDFVDRKVWSVMLQLLLTVMPVDQVKTLLRRAVMRNVMRILLSHAVERQQTGSGVMFISGERGEVHVRGGGGG